MKEQLQIHDIYENCTSINISVWTPTYIGQPPSECVKCPTPTFSGTGGMHNPQLFRAHYAHIHTLRYTSVFPRVAGDRRGGGGGDQKIYGRGQQMVGALSILAGGGHSRGSFDNGGGGGGLNLYD